MLGPSINLRRLFSPLRLAGIGAGLLFGYSVVVAALVVFEDRFVYHPVAASRRWNDPPAHLHFVDVDLRNARNERLHARWYPHPHAEWAVLFCHSRAGNLTLELPAEAIERWSRELGCSILIFDYPCYGRSEGQPSEAGCYEAADLAFDWLVKDQRIAPDRVLIYGRSLGTAVAIELAGRRPHAALVLVSPLTSLPDVAFAQCPLIPTHTLMRNRFESHSRVHLCKQPTFVVHGTRDHLVPFEQGEQIYAALPGQKRMSIVDGAGHGDCITPAFYRELGQFLRSLDPPHSLEGTIP